MFLSQIAYYYISGCLRSMQYKKYNLTLLQLQWHNPGQEGNFTHCTTLTTKYTTNSGLPEKCTTWHGFVTLLDMKEHKESEGIVTDKHPWALVLLRSLSSFWKTDRSPPLLSFPVPARIKQALHSEQVIVIASDYNWKGRLESPYNSIVILCEWARWKAQSQRFLNRFGQVQVS